MRFANGMNQYLHIVGESLVSRDPSSRCKPSVAMRAKRGKVRSTRAKTMAGRETNNSRRDERKREEFHSLGGTIVSIGADWKNKGAHIIRSAVV